MYIFCFFLSVNTLSAHEPQVWRLPAVKQHPNLEIHLPEFFQDLHLLIFIDLNITLYSGLDFVRKKMCKCVLEYDCIYVYVDVLIHSYSHCHCSFKVSQLFFSSWRQWDECTRMLLSLSECSVPMQHSTQQQIKHVLNIWICINPTKVSYNSKSLIMPVKKNMLYETWYTIMSVLMQSALCRCEVLSSIVVHMQDI